MYDTPPSGQSFPAGPPPGPPAGTAYPSPYPAPQAPAGSYPAPQYGAPAYGYAPVAQPVRRRSRLLTARLIVVAVVLLVGLIGMGVRAYNGATNGQTKDGNIVAGDCVTETAVDVKVAECSSSHTGKVSKVLPPGSATCEANLETVPVKDTSGTPQGVLCIDTSDHS